MEETKPGFRRTGSEKWPWLEHELLLLPLHVVLLHVHFVDLSCSRIVVESGRYGNQELGEYSVRLVVGDQLLLLRWNTAIMTQFMKSCVGSRDYKQFDTESSSF